MNKARNMKLLLYMFEQLSGLKINFDKSEILLVGGDDNKAIAYADLFNCEIGMFPLKYLGVPISSGRLHVVDRCSKIWWNYENRTPPILLVFEKFGKNWLKSGKFSRNAQVTTEEP
jgi:hypothetical protein